MKGSTNTAWYAEVGYAHGASIAGRKAHPKTRENFYERKDGEVGMIQIDVPMPKNCAECPCGNYDDIMDEYGCNIDAEIWRIPYDAACEKRDDRCPLKEPPKEETWR